VHLFAPRDTFRLSPNGGAVVTYSLRAASKAPPKIDILDASGAVIRKLDAPGRAGVNRVQWNFLYDPPKLVALRTTPPENPHARAKERAARRREKRRSEGRQTGKERSQSRSRITQGGRGHRPEDAGRGIQVHLSRGRAQRRQILFHSRENLSAADLAKWRSGYWRRRRRRRCGQSF